MIARIWRGAVAAKDSSDYAEYMEQTGLPSYRRIPGNRGVWMLTRPLGETVEFVMFSLWDSLEAIRSFAGEDPDVAVFYPEDDRFLVERDLSVSHFEVSAHAGPDALPPAG